MRDAVSAARIGGRMVLVGIPDGDRYVLPAAEARRRGLSIKFSRRMGVVYPRAIAYKKTDDTFFIIDMAGTSESFHQ